MAVQKYDIRRPLAEGGGFEERTGARSTRRSSDAAGRRPVHHPPRRGRDGVRAPQAPGGRARAAHRGAADAHGTRRGRGVPPRPGDPRAQPEPPRARRDEDRVLLERKPRAPYAPHPRARATGDAAVRERRSAGNTGAAPPDAAQRDTPAATGEHAARFRADRGPASPRIASEPTRLARLRAELASASGRPGERRGLVRRAVRHSSRSPSTSTGACGRRS